MQRGEDALLVKRVAPNAYRGPTQCSWDAANPPFVAARVAVKAPNYPGANFLNDYTSSGKEKGNAYLWLVTKKGQGTDTCDGLPWNYARVDDAAILKTTDATGETYE